MDKKSSIYFGLLLVAHILCTPVSAQNFSDTLVSYHASICEAINPAQSQKMEWREQALINRDQNRSLWVMCPVPMAFYGNSTTDSYFVLVAGSDAAQPVQLTCILRYYVNQNLRSFSQTRSLGPNGRAEFEWDAQNIQLVTPSIACNLPPNTGISGLLGGTAEFN